MGTPMQLEAWNAKVTILQRVDTPNALGEPVPSWQPVAGLAGIWARRLPGPPRELIGNAQLQAPIDARYRIHWRASPAITAAMRLQHGADVYDIVGMPVDLGNERRMLELRCTAGVRDGR